MKVLALLPLCLVLTSCDNEPAPVAVPVPQPAWRFVRSEANVPVGDCAYLEGTPKKLKKISCRQARLVVFLRAVNDSRLNEDHFLDWKVNSSCPLLVSGTWETDVGVDKIAQDLARDYPEIRIEAGEHGPMLICNGARRAEAAPAPQRANLLSLDELLKGPDGSKPIFLIDGRRVTADEVDNILLSKVERIEKMDPGNAMGRIYGAGDGTYVINVVMKKVETKGKELPE